MENNSADKILEQAAETYKERNAIYGDNFLNFGPAMVGLFPEGITLKTSEDFIRFHLLMLDMVKTTRYCNNFDKGGHQDSIHDKVVYCAMLEACDDNFEIPEAPKAKKFAKRLEDEDWKDDIPTALGDCPKRPTVSFQDTTGDER